MKTKLEYQPGIADATKLICEKYWLMRRNKPNEFVHSCQEIGQVFGFRAKDISNIDPCRQSRTVKLGRF